MTQILGITGTRNGANMYQTATLIAALKVLNPKQFHHGDCIGVDFEGAKLAHGMGIYLVSHPPINKKYRAFTDFNNEVRKETDYLGRNRNIVDESDLMLAVPRSYHEILRSGTWHAIRYALKSNKRLYVIWPDGQCKLYTG